MHTVFTIFIAIFVMFAIIGKVSRAYENRKQKPGQAPPRTEGHDGKAPPSVNFRERVRANPTDAGAWAEWGFFLLSQAQEEGLDEKKRITLIEDANGKLSTAHELNVRDYDIPHEWAVELLAAAVRTPTARAACLDKARGLAKKAFDHIDRDEFYYFFDWASALTAIAPHFPEEARRRLLAEALGTLGSADITQVDDSDYFTLWIDTLVQLALLSPKAERVALLEKALDIYNEVPGKERKDLPGDLRKQLQMELDKARLLPEEAPKNVRTPAQVVPKVAGSPKRPAIQKPLPETPENGGKEFAPQAAQTVLPGTASGAEENTRRVAETLHAVVTAQARKEAAEPAQLAAELENFAAPSFSIEPSGEWTPKTAPYNRPDFAHRELPDYARPAAVAHSGKEEEQQNEHSNPIGYKPIQYKRTT